MNIKHIWGLFLLCLLIGFVLVIPLIPLSVEKKIPEPVFAKLDPTQLSANQLSPEHALVFFGFRGCSDICPTTLMVLADLLNNEPLPVNWPQVIFVDVGKDSNAVMADRYAKQFHKNFIGVYPSAAELATLSGLFGLNIREVGNQIIHQGRTYLLQKRDNNWWLTTSYNPDNFSVETLAKKIY